MMKKNATRRFTALLLILVTTVFIGIVALSTAAVAIDPALDPPEQTPSPELTPPAPEELADEGSSGLAPGAWAGIGIGLALLLALVAWLILRRWAWTGS